MKIFWTVVITLVSAVVITCVVGLIVIFSGAYNIAATVHHWGITEWVLDTTFDNSVEAHSKGIVAPGNLNDPSTLLLGYNHYKETCVGCHGAPGVEPEEVAKGLYPSPPDLADSGDLSPAKVYWIATNGVKMTGMPAFAMDSNDDVRWAIAAFVTKIPSMTAEQYGSYPMTLEGGGAAAPGAMPSAESTGAM